MGTPVPIDPWSVDPAKTYNVTVDYWWYAPGPPQCGGTYKGRTSGIKTGAQILAWLNAGYECTAISLIHPPLSGSSERLYTIFEV